jgi:hypothetical protein
MHTHTHLELVQQEAARELAVVVAVACRRLGGSRGVVVMVVLLAAQAAEDWPPGSPQLQAGGFSRQADETMECTVKLILPVEPVE